MSKILLQDGPRLILFSFLMLFVELALIRWLGSNVLFLSVFSNFVLLGSFLGIGVGFLQTKSSNLYRWSPIFLALLILFVSAFPVRITYSGSGLNSILVWSKYYRTGLPIWVTLPIIFLSVVTVMSSLGHGVAISFSRFKPLIAYRLDIVGSLSGIAAFSFLSYFNATPICWGAVVLLTFGLLFFQDWKQSSVLRILQIGSLLIFLIVLGYESASINNFWSPYYKISLNATEDKINGNYYEVWVNGIPHQRIQSMERRRVTEPFYFVPYENRAEKAPPEKVLIIGAGNGGDTAIALAKGAKQVDAIEIDPVLYRLGRNYNPDRPYADVRVHPHINDGRAFLEQTNDRYDLILFALTDSHTLATGQSSLRLESYLFTQEAIQAAYKHLKPNGVLALYNYYLQPWYIDRLANTLKNVFNQDPCIVTSGEKEDWRTVLTISANPAALQCATRWSSLSGRYVEPATDNHPFIYLQNNQIPLLYQVTLFLILFSTLLIVKFTTGTLGALKKNMDFFFMGMAFLLLETKSIAAFSLLFGTTWIVNALVFAGILSIVYLAIETTHRFPRLSSGYLYGLLLLSLAISWILPEHHLLALPFMTRFIVSSLLLFSPIYFANLIFTNQFQHIKTSTTAFGINMIGAMVGGVLEYFALMTGYRFLLILIAVFYTLAFLFGKVLLGRRLVAISASS